MSQETQNWRRKTGAYRRRLLLALILGGLLAGGFYPVSAQAGPTLQDISKSFDHNVSQSPDSGKLLAIVLGAGGIICLLVLASQWAQRREKPRTLNHPGKLVREVQRKVHLSNVQVKRLTMLAERRGCSSPLTVLLCPSLLAQKGERKEKSA